VSELSGFGILMLIGLVVLLAYSAAEIIHWYAARRRR
jgi:hypothetical protein